MTNENLTNEEKSNLDKLNYFYENKLKTHILLKRTDGKGNHIFQNGYLINKLSDRLWLMQEDVLGPIRISISEIKDNGVQLHEDEDEFKTADKLEGRE